MIVALMRYLVALLLAVAAGFGAYVVGAVTWSAIDPDGAGARLLFTIPIALSGMAVPGILGILCYVFRCDLIPEPRPQRLRKPAPAPAPAPARLRVARNPRPSTAPAPTAVQDDLELALAT